ncbi:hypothetical protein D9V86_01740 [Bacteroidetes/Chlorobi group bacterium ChocPot_Mid]|nr:MAG: hypothetical protein D9V86_01740 [Bacteroidetes/Chlorobi group bacterium ChocPot_Mid]
MINKLYIFVEGNDDELFFKTIVIPILREKYSDIEIIQYAQMKKEKVELFILSINTLRFDYILLADIDFFKSVKQKKKYLETRFNNLNPELIYIVIREIESWYFAGISDEQSREFGIKPMKNTNDLVKEEFNLLYHKKFKSRIDFMLELLKDYSIKSAMQKNDSFAFFARNFLFE